jgi:hypothetical protein
MMAVSNASPAIMVEKSGQSLAWFNLETAVERPPGCVPRGALIAHGQGATRRRSGSTTTSCNAARCRAGRALVGVAVITQRVTAKTAEMLPPVNRLHVARSGQLPFLGSKIQLEKIDR